MILARTIARHLRTYILQTNQLILVAPQTPFPELGLQPSDMIPGRRNIRKKKKKHPRKRTR
jgi:hypothetical protein